MNELTNHLCKIHTIFRFSLPPSLSLCFSCFAFNRDHLEIKVIEATLDHRDWWVRPVCQVIEFQWMCHSCKIAHSIVKLWFFFNYLFVLAFWISIGEFLIQSNLPKENRTVKMMCTFGWINIIVISSILADLTANPFQCDLSLSTILFDNRLRSHCQSVW